MGTISQEEMLLKGNKTTIGKTKGKTGQPTRVPKQGTIALVLIVTNIPTGRCPTHSLLAHKGTASDHKSSYC
jgi:hypothetical protein